MAEPQTVNAGLIVPNTGDLVDTWGNLALNPDFVAVDGYLCGVQTISATNAPITLTSPAGFVPTPGGGPTQAQNRVLRFTGALSANVPVTLPLPGSYIIENLTTGNFVLSFQGATATEVVGTPQGERVEIYNDGANVRFVNLGRVGAMEMWAGISAVPAWVAACTVPPYLLCDGTVYNYSAFPYLGPRLAGAFGGNGITTFGTPDMRGRVPLAYDGTGTRITVAGCGINGQTLGASADNQSVTLGITQIPAHNHGVTDPGHQHGRQAFNPSGAGINMGGSNGGSLGGSSLDNVAFTGISIQSAGGGLPHANVQPSIVAGIWVVKT